MDHLPRPGRSRALSTRRSPRARPTRPQMTRTNPPGPGRGGQDAVDGGERVANVQASPTLRDPGGQQSPNVTSEGNRRSWHRTCRVCNWSGRARNDNAGTPIIHSCVAAGRCRRRHPVGTVKWQAAGVDALAALGPDEVPAEFVCLLQAPLARFRGGGRCGAEVDVGTKPTGERRSGRVTDRAGRCAAAGGMWEWAVIRCLGLVCVPAGTRPACRGRVRGSGRERRS